MTLIYILTTLQWIPGEKIMTKSVKEQIHAQITGALKGAKFPVATPKDLIAAFPNGADTTCQVGDLKMTARRGRKTPEGIGLPVEECKGCC